jgi:glutathione synthase/RimK-type ligase-like ATP-grasp enzyme
LEDGRFSVFNLSHTDVTPDLHCSNFCDLGSGKTAFGAAINDFVDVLLFRSFGDVAQNRESRATVNRMLEAMEKNITIPTINPVSTVLKYRDGGKLYLLDLQERGIPMPATFVARSPAELEEAERKLGRCVAKPLVGFGGFCVERFPGGDRRRVYEIIEQDGAVLVQEYLPEIEETGERSLVFFGDRMRYAFFKRPKGGEFRTNYLRWSSMGLYEPLEQERKLGERSIEAMGIRSLLTRVDLCGTPGEPKLIEVTKSCTGLYPKELGAERMIMGYLKDLILDVTGGALHGNAGRGK